MKYFVNAELKFIFDKRIYSHGHQVERYMSFINESFNVDLNAGPLKIHIPKKLSSIKKPILGINPGASYGSAKRWYPDRFAISASKLSDQFDIFIYGGPEDSEIVNDIKNKLDELNVKNYKILAGEMSVAELVISISKLDLFITADSGPMHIASAFKIPSICLFGPTKDSETSQWMNSESIILKANLECQPCMKKTCPLKHHNCMKAISSEDVVKNSLNLLGQVKIN